MKKIGLNTLRQIISEELLRVSRHTHSFISEARSRRLENKLIKCLDASDRCNSDEKYRYPNGRDDRPGMSTSGDRAYGIELEIADILDQLENLDYTEQQIKDIDPRITEFIGDV